MLEIIVDVREHALIEKLRGLADSSSTSQIVISTRALLIGDILFMKKNELTNESSEIILFERKSFVDLLASIKDGRYDEQSHRIIHTSGMHTHNIVYILEGIFSTLRSPMDKKIILSAMTSLSYFKGFSVFRTATVLETAELILAMANKIQKEFDKGKPIPHYSIPTSHSPTKFSPVVSSPVVSSPLRLENHPIPPLSLPLCLRSGIDHSPTTTTIDEVEPINTDIATATSTATATTATATTATATTSYGNFVKKAKRDNITPENIGEILLSQIPGISNHIAAEILKHYDGSFSRLIQEIKTAPEKLDSIYLESSKGDGKRRKLSSSVIQSIKLFLGYRYVEIPSDGVCDEGTNVVKL